jgi:hypothetical protein
MMITRKRLKLGLLFTSTAVLVPKIACAETKPNLDSENKNTSEQLDADYSSSATSIEDVSVSIAKPESVSESKVSNFSKPAKASDLKKIELENQQSPICPPSNIQSPEFTQAASVDNKKTENKSCRPDTVGKTEFSAQKIEIQPNVVELEPNKNFIIAPQVINNKNVPQFTTTIPLNGTKINHLTEWKFTGNTAFGDNRNNSFDVNALLKINSQIEQSLTKNNIFSIDYRGDYLQLQTVRKKREIIYNRTEPQTLLGTEIQLSLTGSCLIGNVNPNQQCTYIPSIVTDKNAIDPNTLLPTRLSQNSKLGDVVTPESIAAMKQPGFQLGANGQEYGTNLFFPKAGAVYGNGQSNQTSITRKENIQNTPVGIYSTIRQIVRANHKEAVIGRTIRGFGIVGDDKNFLINSAFQLTGLVLPDADPQIEGGVNPANQNINRNLFLAANNVRLPTNSYTFYQAGIGKAKTPAPGTKLNQISAANFDSIWIGVSPVTKYSLSNKSRYELTSSRRILSAGGAEGGTNSNINFSSTVNGQEFSTRTLKDFYSQVYLTMFEQDANLIRTSKLTEETNYYPHISISGNSTGINNVWRYYGGMIGGDKINAYLGTDFTRYTFDGWTFSAGGIAYTNPDNDYYSQLSGSVSKKITLGKSSNLVLSTGINYAFDRKTDFGNYIIDSPASSVTLGARANFGAVSMGLVNYFGDILPNSIANTLLTDISLKVSDNFQISAYYTPINQSSSRSPFGAKAQWKLGNNDNSPTLSLAWNNNEYKFANDPLGNKLGVTDNVFSVLFKFGNF